MLAPPCTMRIIWGTFLLQAAAVLAFDLEIQNLSPLRHDTSSAAAGESIWPTSQETPNTAGPTDSDTEAPARRRPNILIVMADDLGHADLGYSEGSIQTPTPNINKFAHDGVILNRHYSNPLCTPTRGAFLTGKHAFQLGLQTGAIDIGEPWGLPLKFKTQPEYSKQLGYSTAIVGKWHLGMHTRRHLPDARGFDYSLVVSGGDANWRDYTVGRLTPLPVIGGSLNQNEKIVPVNETNARLLPELITATAERLIDQADPSKPWYLFYATPVPHTAWIKFKATQHDLGVSSLPASVRSALKDFPDRQKQLAAIRELDNDFGRLVRALERKKELDNTIIVFLADNGAPNAETADIVHGYNHGSNWPLRMGKGTYFEGGVRTLSFLWSPLLKKTKRVTDQLFHITDWLPTLYEAVGGKLRDLGDVAGVSQWSSLTQGTTGPRTELVNNIDTVGKGYAMVDTDLKGRLYKLIGGNVLDNNFFGWDRTEGTTESDTMTVRTATSVQCGFPEGTERTLCRPQLEDCLFDLTDDPCEANNIADKVPDILKRLQRKIAAYNMTSYPAQIQPFDYASNPRFHDGFWVPWVSDSI